MSTNKEAIKKNVSKTGKRPSNKKFNAQFNLNNSIKKNKNFMYQNVTKARCYNCDFSASNFDFVSFRGSSMKSCRFSDASFNGSEFIGTNLKESDFSRAVLKNVVFETAKLEDVNFKDVEFTNVIFLETDTSIAKNLDLNNDNIRVFDKMPELTMSDELTEVIQSVMANKYVKAARVLDTREGKINNLSIMILLENFSEEEVIKGLSQIEDHIDRDFYTLSFIITLIKKIIKL